MTEREKMIEIMAEAASRSTSHLRWDVFSEAYRDNCRAEMRAALAAAEAVWTAGLRRSDMDATQIQELKRLAEKYAATEHGKRAGLYAQYMRAASPSTILALIEENERLREALKPFAATAYSHPEMDSASSVITLTYNKAHLRRARAVLKEPTDV